jgi:hypothetical protein
MNAAVVSAHTADTRLPAQIAKVRTLRRPLASFDEIAVSAVNSREKGNLGFPFVTSPD